MSGQIIQIRSIALAVPLLVWGVGIGIPTNPARADDCVTAPRSAAPKGSHWYYRIDRANRRKCWYLGQQGQHTAAKASAATTVAYARAVEKPATASTGALMSTSAGGSTPPSRPLKAQPAPMSGATALEPVQQRAQETSTAPSNQEAPGPLASASWQTSVQAAGAAPAATIVWPDPPAVPPVKAQKPYLVLSDAGADTVFPTVDVRAPDDSEGAAKGGASTTDVPKGVASSTDVPWVEGSPAAAFVEILLVVAFGLTLAGLLYRVVLKIAARRGRRAIFDHSKSGWMDDRHQREWPDDRQDDLYPSLVPAAGDYSARCPLRADDECQNNARRKNSASVTDEVSRRENTLQQLILDLDQMLQSRKWRSGAGGHFSHLRP